VSLVTEGFPKKESVIRIVSFLPSATEIVYALGIGDQLHGVTHECDYPPQALDKPTIIRGLVETQDLSSGEIDEAVRESSASGALLYQIDHEALKNIQPDIVLTQGLCDVCAVPTGQAMEAIEDLVEKPQVLSLHPHSLDGLFDDILAIGEVVGVTDRSEQLVESLKSRRSRIVSRASMAAVKPTVVCLEWLDPLMVGGHWVPEMVELAGGVNSFGERGQESYGIEWEQLMEAQPDCVVAMPCGFNVRRGISEIQLLTDNTGWGTLPAAKYERLFVVDGGAYFSRSGPRLLEGLEILAEILHPELFAGFVPEASVSRIRGQLFKVS